MPVPASHVGRPGASLHVPALVLAVVLLATACEASPAPTASPARTPGASAAAPDASPSAETVETAPPAPSTPPPSPAALAPGVLAVTVTDGLRVRSAPRVAEDSLKFEPVLPAGTELVIAAGPVEASGYTWYRVAPTGIALNGGVDQGWVAAGDHDGTPWVALADDPTPGFELAATTTDAPRVSMAAAKREAKAVNAFGLALYRRLRSSGELKGKGIVFSPLSISTALAMARAGAKGRTATEIDDVLNANDWPALAAGLASLDRVLARRDGAFEVIGESSRAETHYLSLRSANMAFAQDGYDLEAAYLERVSQTFRSGIGLVDYINDAEAARKAINGWVGRQTLGRIPELLNGPDVKPATRLILVNAVYFKGEWERPFDADATHDRDFTTAAGKTVKVPTMEVFGDQQIPLANGDGWQATELRYLGPDARTPLAMTLVMPDNLGAFEKRLSAARLSGITEALRGERARLSVVTPPSGDDCGSYPYQTRLFMPKFGVEIRQKLVPILSAMGIERAFDPELADFSGMTATDRLHIGMVVHQANIDVDERGTEAAAATAVGVDTGGCTGPQPLVEKPLRLDRPFLFFVRDLQTGAILFMGRVTDPRAR